MTGGANNHNGSNGLSRDARAAQAALRRLPLPAVSDEARARARLAFLRGEAPRVTAPIEREPLWRSRVTPLAIAVGIAAAVLAIVWYGRLPAEQWFVTDVIGPEGIRVEGDSAPARGSRLDARDIATGPESEIEIQLGGRLRFRMLPDSRLQLPAPPGRWFGRERSIDLADGEIYGTTGANPLPFALTVETQEATARILGTTFAVLRIEVGTCVCLWNGGVEVTSRSDGVTTRLREEMKFYVYKDGRASEMVPIDDMERMKLSMTDDAGLAPIPEGLD